MRKSNYPRTHEEEEEIVVYRPWQWGVLFVAVMITSFLKFWMPTISRLSPNLRWFATADYLSLLVCGVMLLSLPFLWGGGSLVRAVLDRLREPSTHALIWLGGLVAAVEIIPTMFHAIPAMVHGASFPVAFRMYSLKAFPLLPTGGMLIHSIGTYFFYLLVLTIPSAQQRVKILSLFVAWQIGISISGSYVFAQMYPYVAQILPHASSTGMWIFDSIANPILFYLMIWILDRVSFPTFRPFLMMFGVYLVIWLFFRHEIGIGEVAGRLGALLITVGYALSQKPEALQWPWKDEEALQSA